MNTRQHSDNANDKWATLTRADIPPAMIVLIMTPMLLVPIMPKPRPEPSLIRSMTSTCTSGELNCTHQTQQLADIFIYDSENIRLEETTSTKKTKTKNKNDILQKWYDTTSSHKQRAVCPNTFNFRCKHHLLQHSINCRLTHKINVKKNLQFIHMLQLNRHIKNSRKSQSIASAASSRLVSTVLGHR